MDDSSRPVGTEYPGGFDRSFPFEMKCIDVMNIRRLVFVVLAWTMPGIVAHADLPNVLVICADDLGYADMSFLDHSPADVFTPAIDAIAAQGTYFREAYSTAPICSPSRAGLVTGRYQQRWGNYWYGQGGLPAREMTIPKMLRTLGYETTKLGKTHLNGGEAEHPLDHGFDRHLGFIHHTWDYIRLSSEDVKAYQDRAEGKSLGILNVGPLTEGRDKPVSYEQGFTTKIFTDAAIETIRSAAVGDQPFYLQLEYNAVHMPTYVTDPAYARRAGYEQPEWDRNADRWEFPFWDPREKSWQQWHKEWGHLGKVDPIGRKRYLANLTALDDGIGRLTETLRDTGLERDTIVVFLSDNGGTINTYSNNRPLRGYKYMFGEGGIRIPLIISWPGKLPAGKVVDGITSAMDVFPTIVDLLDQASPDDLDGKSLLRRLIDDAESPHDHLCWADGKGTWVVRQGPWKLIESAGWTHSNYELDEKGIASPAQEVRYPKGRLLFNLESDVGETENVADKHPQRVQEMTRLYQSWRQQMGKPVRAKKK